MRLSIIVIFAAMLMPLLSSSPASAQWDEFWDRCRSDWDRNNCWPRPFTYQDREAVNGPLAMMAANGWQREMTLAAYHFDPITQELNSAGQNKLTWILTQSPEFRRTIFVLNDRDPDITSARMSNVQIVASSLAQSEGIPGLVVTDISPRGISAGYIDSMNKQRQETQPPPVLPAIDIIGQQ